MGVSVIQGLQNLIDFADYNASVRAAQYFTSYSEAYNYMLENAYKSGSSAMVRGIIDGGRVSGKIVEFQPRLTGGTQVGVDVAEVTEVGGEVGVAGGAATLTATPLIEMLGGILAGLGIGIVSYEANKDFWVDVSNNLFLNVPGYQPIRYDNIEDMSIATLFKNGKTYVSADVIQEVNNKLIAMGVYTQGQTSVVVDIPTEPGNYSFDSAEVTPANVHASFGELLNNLNLNAIQRVICNKAVDYLIADIPSSAYTASTNYMVMVPFVPVISPENPNDWAQAGVEVYFYNDELPLDRTLSAEDIHETYANVPNSGHRSIYGARAYCAYYGGQEYSHQVDKPIGTDSYAVCIGFDLTNRRLCSFNNNIIVSPTIPELPLLQPATWSTRPNSIPIELPDWWQHILEIGQIDPDTLTRIVPQFLPVGVPGTSPVTNPVTTPQPDIQTGNVPDTNTKPVDDSELPIFKPDPTNPWKKPTDPTPKPTPTPTIPTIPTIGGQANALFTVYNPSQANLNSLGGVLWSQNIIEQIVQMFTNNPMDAIISLHILYATPSTGNNKEIKLGYLPTGISCPEVNNQYVNINCGTVRVPELFGDVRDYANTDVTIYLPMIGFRQLKTEDAMASYITVDYKVDVFTGTVLANVIVSRDSVNQTFYTFEGNCAVNLPLTGADKSRQLATAVGVIGASVIGSPLMGMASMAGVAGGGARANLTRSGNFTGNAGAMGCKKPYIIVSSDVPYDAVAYNTQYGYPANLTVMLGTCHGYVKAKEVHADSISNATEKEKREIENQLKQGVIIH